MEKATKCRIGERLANAFRTLSERFLNAFERVRICKNVA